MSPGLSSLPRPRTVGGDPTRGLNPSPGPRRVFSPDSPDLAEAPLFFPLQEKKPRSLQDPEPQGDVKEMGYLVSLAAILNMLLYFGMLQSEGNNVFQPVKLNVSMNRTLQQLLLEWNVSDDMEAYNSEVKMDFDIQIYRRKETDIVFSENYSTTINKSNHPLKLTWHSDVPLECMPHGVRIRSRVAPSETWSDWSAWEIKDGMDPLDDGSSYIFPVEKVIEKGSSITFCCIAKKNDLLTGYLFNGSIHNNTKQRRITFTEKNVPLSLFGGINVICAFSQSSDNRGTLLFVTSKPDKPKYFDCETEDMMTLKCIWDPGRIDEYINLHQNKCAANFTLSDVSNGQVYCSCSGKCKRCEFNMTSEQMNYSLRLTAQNCVGWEHTDTVVDVAHKLHLAPPDQLSVSYQNATTIQLFWNLKPTRNPLQLLCQVNEMNDFHPEAKEKEHNITGWFNTGSPLFINLYGLQSYANYTLKVRCGAAAHLFWKWSEWSKTITIQTNESAPSGKLDIWSDISPCLEECNVTVFWKTPTGFRANGNIKTYEICWKNVEEPNVHCHCHSTELNNYTISLGSRSYEISVSARNSANASTPSLIIISASGTNDLNYSEESTANNTAHGIYLSWKTRDTFDGYVIDWCMVDPLSQTCRFQWKRFGQNVSSALITSDDFSPGVKYTFRIYGMEGDRAYLLEKKVKYLEEQEPAHDPLLSISAITSDTLTIHWDSYPENSLPGFIRGYNVYVKMEHGNCNTLQEFEQLPGNPTICKYTIKNRNQKNYTVRHLKPNTVYLLTVQAYSVNPGNKSLEFQRITTQSDRSWGFLGIVLLIAVPLLLIACTCFWKSDCVWNRLVPEIPRPYVSPFQNKSLIITDNSGFTPDKLLVMKKPVSDNEPDLGKTLEHKFYLNPNYCPNQQEQDVTSKKPNSSLTPYQPLQDFLTSKITCSPLEAVQNNFSYTSQNNMLSFVVQQSNTACFVENLQQSNYKNQFPMESPPRPFVSVENMDFTAASQTLCSKTSR
uniref:Oncostatin M receptor n=1 Tax=Anolis carolinensis TaxID=28377 RepID=H9GFT4_ANOCA